MFNKSILVQQVANSLMDREFEVFITHGCFDIAARRERLLLLKTLLNVDGLSEAQALSLRAIAYFLSAYPFVISIKCNKGALKNDIVYSRFSLPVLTPKLFTRILDEKITVVYSSKGKHTVEINVFTLRERRKELNYTLEELARAVGITKKAMYEIENQRVQPSMETAKRLEDILGVKLRMAYDFQRPAPIYLEPRDEFQERVSKELHRIGIDNSSVYSAPFDIVGKEKLPIVTTLLTNERGIKQKVRLFKRLSSVLSSLCIFITKKYVKPVEGVSILMESELSEINSPKELRKVATIFKFLRNNYLR